MKTTFLFMLVLLITACSKQHCKQPDMVEPMQTSAAHRAPKPSTSTFTKYTIQEGAHECDQRSIRSVSGTSMNFTAKFDSTAIYPAVITDYNHAYDVNKLWGFSEGLNNQYNSARIGWRWLNDQLELFAYVYVNGTLLRDPVSYDPPFIKTVAIGSEINCSIAVSGSNYIFTVDGIIVKTSRGTSVSKFNGYQQYPYFGGNLTAPHLINIYIK
jgi:hypothetical protein